MIETVNDLDADLMTFWRVLRDSPEDLERACALTPYSRAEYEHAHHGGPPDNDLERARRVWVQLTQGRAGLVRNTNGWRRFIDPNDGSSSGPGFLRRYLPRIPAAAERLAGVTLECRPALEVIADYGACPEVLIYADPPYLGNTRAGAREKAYRFPMLGAAGHAALAEALRACRAAVVLSGYDSPEYAVEFAGWHRHEIRAQSMNASVRARTEVLWSNRPLGVTGVLF
jgi:DNA adenine methylase